MPTWLIVTSVVAAAVLLVSVGKWVGGVNADRKHLKQDTDRDRKAFAEATKAARSFMGFRVEDTRSEPWGVLVIDSRGPDFDTQRAQEASKAYSRVLARLVQGI